MLRSSKSACRANASFFFNIVMGLPGQPQALHAGDVQLVQNLRHVTYHRSDQRGQLESVGKGAAKIEAHLIGG